MNTKSTARIHLTLPSSCFYFVDLLCLEYNGHSPEKRGNVFKFFIIKSSNELTIHSNLLSHVATLANKSVCTGVSVEGLDTANEESGHETISMKRLSSLAFRGDTMYSCFLQVPCYLQYIIMLKYSVHTSVGQVYVQTQIRTYAYIRMFTHPHTHIQTQIFCTRHSA